MAFVASAMPRCWGFDTNEKLSRDAAHGLKAAPFPGMPTFFLFRYASLGAPSPADLTPSERDDIFDAGWSAIGLVQHVEYPHWSADPTKGSAHGAAAVAHARLCEYPAGCHLAVDIEGVGTPGSPVYEYLKAWAAVVHAAGFRVLAYDGYDDGLPFELKVRLKAEGIVDDWWSDFGPRMLPPDQRFVVKQHVQTTVAGVKVDPDEILVPGALVLMTREPSAQQLAQSALAQAALAAPPAADESDVPPADRTTQPELPES